MARRKTERVSVATGGTQVNALSDAPFVTADGRLVAFASDATNVVPGDTNAMRDVFVHDRSTLTTTRVSVATGGGESDGLSFGQAISADGRYVVFSSDGTNLVAGDTNARRDIFVRDRTMSGTERVSVATGSGQGDGSSFSGSISDDGRFVTFGSRSTNLVAGDTNAFLDVFVRDRQAGVTTRVSVSSLGAQGASTSQGGTMSKDGRYVVFDGNAVLVPGDVNGTQDVLKAVRVTRHEGRSETIE